VLTSIGCGVFRPIGGDGQIPSLAHVAQLAEHVLGKDEVTGSIPVMGSNYRIFGHQKK
jgi:hypothetical protein